MRSLNSLFAAAGVAALLAGCAYGPLEPENAYANAMAAGPRSPANTPASSNGAPAPQAAPVAKATSAAVWPQQVSDLKPDPGARFGQLPNGMRYILYRNVTPATEASLRLRIDAGSLNEAEDQRGIAHFIEHMVLNGTKNVPEGEFVRRLERAGLQFGPDTNASTLPEQTTYELDLPETDAATVDTGLLLLREVAGEALFDPAAIDRERGIVLSEERTRNGPDYRAFIQRLGFVFKGQRIPTRLPIGDVEVIRTAPRERFARFYDAFYRPERATLIAVGDFDVDVMERKIRERFSDWRGRGAPGADPDLGRIAQRGSEALVIVEPAAQEQLTVSWIQPSTAGKRDTREERRQDLLDALGFAVLNNRLQRLATGQNPPFTAAASSWTTQFESADVTDLVAVPEPGRWREALTALDQEQRRLVQYGVTAPELARAIADTRGALTAAVAGAGTRRSPALAEQLVSAVNEDEVFTTPADDLALFEEVAKAATPETVSAAAREGFSGQGPVLTLVSRQPVNTGGQALLNAYQQSRQLAVAAPAAEAAKTWAYTSFGTPGRVVEQRADPALGATFVRFANGVRLTVRPSQLRKDQVLVNVRVGDGRLDIPTNKPSPEIALPAFTLGGLGKLTTEEIQEVLAGRVVGVNAGVDDDAFTLSGGTRPADFPLQMQVLTAFLTDPAYRPAAWERVRTALSTVHDQLEGTPGGVFQRDAEALLHSGDRRWVLPSRQEIAASRVEDLRSVLQPAFSNEPIEVIVTGDIAVEEAIKQTAATFGALPARRAGTVPAAARRVAFPSDTRAVVRRTHKGRPDQGLAFIAWPTTDFYADPKRARTLNLLSDVLQLRLTDEIREKQGATYSPGASHSADQTFAGYGVLSAQIEAPPERLDAFLTDAEKIARELREKPVTADELERARRPRLEQIQRAQAGNQWWLANLERAATDPRVAASLATLQSDYRSVTPADLQRVAREYLIDSRAYRIVVAPEAKPAAS